MESSEAAETTASHICEDECSRCSDLWNILAWAARSEYISEEIKSFARALLDDWSK